MPEPTIFLSYTSLDKERVKPFYLGLKSQGLDPWMDQFKLKAGQNWDFEIRRALDRATIILLFLSKNPVDKRGYVQRELKLALKKREEKLVDDIYIIPVQLDEIERPEELRSVQFVDGTKPEALQELSDTIHEQLRELKLHDALPKTAGDIIWRIQNYIDKYHGIPGYAIEAQYLSLESPTYPAVDDAATYISGWIADLIMGMRSNAADPDPRHYNLAQDSWARTHTLDVNLSEVKKYQRSLSIHYSVHTYFAGAAHPNSGIRTFNFLLLPFTQVNSIRQIFDRDEVLSIIQQEARQQFQVNLSSMHSGGVDEAWIDRGTEKWESFERFVFDESGVKLFFNPYQVAAYAYGPQSALVPYDKIVGFLTERVAHSLGLDWKRRKMRGEVA